MEKDFATVIMAAGKGTRMKNSEKAKVMFELAGKPMIQYVVELALALKSSRVITVVGFQRESVIAHVRKVSPMVEFAVQDPQLGTGHAIMQAKMPLHDFEGNVLVLSGDVPLLRQESANDLITFHHTSQAVATILTADLEEPTGYGRILRDEAGHVVGIVEEKDATPAQRKVQEINSGIYIFDSVRLFEALSHINAKNAQGEYYLTDVFGYFWAQHLKVAAKKGAQFNELRGINTLEQLQEAERLVLGRNIA
ncbi:MAG TPA: sugar phosphate nucleotidyltransferase [Bacteroidota bacterium]|nr:sugar phosphate nucleotidyltransferase [Bacteroidota bacterium]